MQHNHPLLPNGSKILPEGPVGPMSLPLRVTELNRKLRQHSATELLAAALDEAPNLALVSSFGAESVVLLHLASRVHKDIPILFLDTELLFPETLTYHRELTRHLGLRNVTTLRSENITQQDPQNTLHLRDASACCELRKTLPLRAALRGFEGWITGRKRYQSNTRAALPHFECEERSDEPPLLKVNPLAYWTSADVTTHIENNHLPRHPLVARGYPSIGCLPCTAPVKPGEDPRAGRWQNSKKDECGIHFSANHSHRTGTYQ